MGIIAKGLGIESKQKHVTKPGPRLEQTSARRASWLLRGSGLIVLRNAGGGTSTLHKDSHIKDVLTLEFRVDCLHVTEDPSSEHRQGNHSTF